MRNDTGHQLYKFDTNWITNSKMADKMAAVQGMAISQAFIFHCQCYSILHFAVCQLLGWDFLFCTATYLTQLQCSYSDVAHPSLMAAEVTAPYFIEGT